MFNYLSLVCSHYLFSVVVFEGCLKSLLHPLEGNAHICGPPHLTTSQPYLRTDNSLFPCFLSHSVDSADYTSSYLCGVVEEPLVSWFVFIGSYGLLDLLPNRAAHGALQGT